MAEKDLWHEIPGFAWISLARRGMEKISLDQCFLSGCDNQDPKLLEPFKMEEFEDDKKHIKQIHIECKKCGGIFQFKLETLKHVAKPTKTDPEKLEDDEILSMGIVYALDEYNADGSHMRFKVNGRVKRWKRDPDRVQVPVKRGLYEYGYIDNGNFEYFSLTDEEVKA